MRRKSWIYYGRWIAAALILSLALGVFLALMAPPNAPKFRRGVVPEGPFTELRYPFLDYVPVSEGLTWVAYNPATNSYKVFFLEFKDGAVLGELVDAEPEVFDGRSGQVFCRTIRPRRTGLIRRIFAFVERFAPSLVPAEKDEMFWVVNLQSGNAKFIGRAPTARITTMKTASPGFTKVYDIDKHGRSGSVIRLFHLSEAKLEEHELPGWPLGWWSETEILYKLDAGGLGIYRIDSKLSGTIQSVEAIEEWLQGNDVKMDASKIATFSMWDGTNYNFFATETHDKWLGTTSILARVVKEDRSLKMLDPSFKFGWSDHLHPDGRHYVYTGRDSGNNSSAVFVRDLRERSDKMIIPPDGAYFSIPNFYQDWIVFMRSNMLWRTDLNGSNTVRLFPPSN